MATLAKRSGVDSVRLEGKIVAAKKLLEKTTSGSGDVRSSAGASVHGSSLCT